MKKNWFTLVSKGAQATILLYGIISRQEGDINDKDFIDALNNLPAYVTSVDIRINCEGGSVPIGLSIYYAMKRSTKNITCYVDGIAGSMGSIIALGGRRVVMAKNAKFMIHQPTGTIQGQIDDIKNGIELMQQFIDEMKAIYKAETQQPDDVIESWMAHGVDRWFTADEAFAVGLCDEVTLDYVEVDQYQLAGKTTAEIVAVYDEKIQVKNQNKVNMPKQLLAPVLGLDPNADDTAFVSAVQTLKNKATEVDSLRAQIATYQDTQIKDVIAQAKKEGKFTDLEAPAFEAILKADLENGKRVIATIKAAVTTPAPVAPVAPVMLPAQMIANAQAGQPQPQFIAGIDPSRATWNFMDWMKNDPDGLEAMEASNKTAFDALYRGGYKVRTEI